MQNACGGRSAEGAGEECERGGEAFCGTCEGYDGDIGRQTTDSTDEGGNVGARGAEDSRGRAVHRRRTDTALVFSERARELLEERVGEWHWRPRFGDG